MTNINKITLLLMLGSLLIASSCVDSTDKNATIVYLVRHAEKKSGENPELSEKGSQRALNLSKVLTDVNISRVYSTNYKRTKQTVQPLASQKGLEIITYSPVKALFLDSLLLTSKGNAIVVSGHSNTIPILVNRLLDKDSLDVLGEDQYGDLFKVELANDTTLSMMKF